MSAEVAATAASIGQAMALMRARGKTFAWSARALTRDARFDAALLYAFARRADDIADEEESASLTSRQQALARLIADCERGESTDAACSAALEVVQRRSVSPTVLVHLLQSLEQDMQPRVLQTEAELLRYAYGVAGTVGLLMRPIVGAAAHADAHAVALGLAMQLTNIARDVYEDAARGRVYVPAEFFNIALAPAPTPEQLLLASPAVLKNLEQALARVLALADQLYAFAGSGLAQIPARNRHAISLAAQLYRQIGVKLQRAPLAQTWGGRVSVNATEKAWISLQVLLRGAWVEDYKDGYKDGYDQGHDGAQVEATPAKLAALVGLPGVSW